MIHIIVGTTHLSTILGYSSSLGFHLAGRGEKNLHKVVEILFGKPILSAQSADELTGQTVYGVLSDFHKKASQLMLAPPHSIMTNRKRLIQRMALRDYYLDDFEVSAEDACNSLAIHDTFQHGRLAGNQNGSFLPDLGFGVRYYACFATSSPELDRFDEIDFTIQDLIINQFVRRPTDFEFHLCDDLRAVYDRLQGLCNQRMPVRVKHQTLVIDGVVEGLTSFQSMRRASRRTRAIGHHRVLAGQVTRQAIGKRVLNRWFPIDRWRQLDEPVQHFLLDAAEVVGTSECHPVYPNLPSRQEMQSVSDKAAETEGSWVFGKKQLEFQPTQFDSVLRKMGIRGAVTRLADLATVTDRYARSENAFDWAQAIREIGVALNNEDIERSLQLRSTLDLYPLHKRVLGLVENIILPRLEGQGFDGKASRLWTNGFLEVATDSAGKKHTGPLNSHRDKSKLGRLATLETEGNWLLHAYDHAVAGGISPIDLAALLDGIVTRMTDAKEVTGVSVSLQPATPQVHARQLAALADSGSNNAACMTLYLGKVALMLRNAVEHGTDCVTTHGLKIDCKHYWDERGGVLDWDKNAAKTVNWRHETALCNLSAIPGPAEALLLTPASLHRCLVLMSLVLHAGFSQLGI